MSTSTQPNPFTEAAKGFTRAHRFAVYTEYGHRVESGLSYQRAVELAYGYRTNDHVDHWVVDTSTDRRVSEVWGFNYDG